ncbi:MAG: leucine-rich repeat domain-containing protein, partial [Bacteroidaceae bacterium]|nr:leucine-rich repeat domain-containing protein [Bacteroidaceae bacterium]
QVVAKDFIVNGIYYSITSTRTVAVTSGSKKYVGSVVIPESIAYDDVTYSVTTIGNSAFAYCTGLTSITIPNSVTAIGNSAFNSCNSLTSVTIPNSVTSISNYAFADCRGLISITIGNSVTTISQRAFAGCESLTSVTIPNSVTSIGETAFEDCSGLTSVIIPNSVTTIGHSAFYGCEGLTSITIPNSVTTIGHSAFAECTSLSSITIPNSVTIGNGAFAYCYNLKDFYCHAESVPTTGNRIFYEVNLPSATLHVPEASLQKYGSRVPWSKFGQIVATDESGGRRMAKPRKGTDVIGGRKTAVR